MRVAIIGGTGQNLFFAFVYNALGVPLARISHGLFRNE
jgi:cation transport ATPase